MTLSVIETRRTAIDLGYIVIPLIGKKPAFKAWTALTSVSPAMLEDWDRDWPHATNTGVLTRPTPSLDLDLLYEPAASAAEAMVRERYGARGRILIRIGRFPKRAIPFRAGAPFKKLTTNFVVAPGQEAEKVEFLASGQQLAAFGVHPDTHGEYTWSGGDPSTVAHDELPEISGAEARQLQDDLVAMLARDFGYTVATPARGNGRAGARGRAAPKSTARDTAWARAALDAECAAVARAPNGDRNTQLNLSAYNTFQIVWGDPSLLNEDEVRERLFEAARACGLVDDDGEGSVWKTIRSGCEAARSQPRVRPVPALTVVPNGGSGLGLAGASATIGTGAGTGTGSGSASPSAPQRLIIQMLEGNKSEILDEVERELVGRYQGFGLYQRGGQLVRAIRISTADADNRATLLWRLAPVEPAHLFEVFTRIIDFQKFSQRRGEWVSTDCPMQLPIMYEARRHWEVPTLLGIVHTPQLRADGSLVEATGYDPGTRLLFKFDGEIFPPIPEHPTKADADAALKLVEEAISTFPFKTAVDRSVVLSMFLTVLAQRSFELAPLHGISAPAPATGKSLLVALASILASGQTAPVIAMGTDKNEFRKLFAAQLLSGVPIIAIDNCERPLTGDLLCQAVTEEQKEIRLFGHLKTALVAAGSLITATGNNLTIGSDLSRRVLMSMLDAGVERPEKRVFKVRIKKVFRQRRGELVSALLSVLRAGRLARAEIEQLGLEPLGGLEDWCAWVRDSLVWLGRADPVLSVETSYENNVDHEGLRNVISAWSDDIGLGTALLPQQIIDQMDQRGTLGAYRYPTLREALLQVAEDYHSSGKLSAKRLGWWLRKVNGQPIGNLRLVKVKMPPKGHPHWVLETI